MDKTEEEKLNDVSEVSSEDLVPAPVEAVKEDIAAETKPENEQSKEIPTENAVETVDMQGPLVSTDKTDEQNVIRKEEIMEESQTETGNVKEHVEQKVVAETDAEEEVMEEEPKERPGSVSETEDIHRPVEEKPCENLTTLDTDVSNDKESIVELSQELDSVDLNGDQDGDTTLGGDESPAEVLVEEETKQSQPSDVAEDKAPEEAELPEGDNQEKEDVKMEEKEPIASDVVSNDSKDTCEDFQPVVPSVSLKQEEEKTPSIDESSSHDAVSVFESETDSETKTEQGSPAVLKPDVEKDSDSGSSSAADSNSLDLNLSISSFLSKSKEGGSVSVQVMSLVPAQICLIQLSLL